MTPLLLLEYWVLKQSPQFDDLMLRISWGYQISWSIVCDDSDCVWMNVCNEWSVLYHHNVSRCLVLSVVQTMCHRCSGHSVSIYTPPLSPSSIHTISRSPACLYQWITLGWQNLNPLSYSNATLAPQARQARASSENLTLAPQVRQVRANLNFVTLVP